MTSKGSFSVLVPIHCHDFNQPLFSLPIFFSTFLHGLILTLLSGFAEGAV